MKIPEKIKKLVKIIWWFIGAVGLIFGLVVGYQEYFRKQPSIFSQIISETNVLDVHESLKDLQILFQGENIQEKNLNLKIYRVKIENNGGTNITQNDFDQNSEWGIKLEKERIIEARLIDSNSEYIKANLSPQIKNNMVEFNKIIFDKGNFFIIELLVLHDKDVLPALYRIGKIAGIKESESKILALEYHESFWPALFYGNWLVNIVRFVLYAIASVVIFITIAVILVKRQEKKIKAAQSPQPPQQPI